MTTENDKVVQTEPLLKRLNEVTALSKYFALVLFITLPFIGGWIGYTYAPTKEIVVDKLIVTSSEQKSPQVENLRKLFNLESKKPGTEIFYEKALGIGFTYEPYSSWSTNKVIASVEKNIISLHYEGNISATQTIEVFVKDPAQTLEESITERFLANISPEKCFIEQEEVDRYVKAYISFPIDTSDPDNSFNLDHGCPIDYTKSNGVAYFLFNPEVPNKYIFVSVGQDIITGDGSQEENYSWSHSIQIVE